MSSDTYLPGIEQAALLNFKNSFHELAQQKSSELENSGAIIYLPSKGKTNMMARIGRLELTEVNTRNPDKQYSDYAVDNRQFTKRRFTKTVQIDAKYDINELLKDPTSDIMKQLVNGTQRLKDRIALQAAVGNVLVGAPDATPTSISAATDGVVTVAATGGVTYDKILEITENFINNDVPMDSFKGSMICLTGKEHTALMSEVEFINNDYMNGDTVNNGVLNNAGMYKVKRFAGSKSGLTVVNPMLPEVSTTRTNVVLAPGSIAMAIEIGDMSVTKSALKVNSFDITTDVWVNAMRTEGALVQLFTSTI
jgi:hypothetical protein